MNLWPFTKPAAQPLRAIVATRSESLAARRRAADRMLELAVYKATTTKAQRKAEADAWFAAQLTYAAETRRGR